jgi:hypothetical protein
MSSVVFACVAENRPDFATMAYNLVISIRAFAGELAQAPVVVSFVDAVEDEFAQPLEELGAEVRVVERVSAANPLANKLRMLELADERAFDVLVATDCDVVLVGDPSPWIDPKSISAKPADFDRFTDEEWRSLFAVVGVAEPAKVLTATATGQRTYPYFNSGVLFVPHGLCRPLREAWTRTYTELSSAIERDPHALREQWRWLVEQASLGLAILREDLPWQALPPQLNFPGHVTVPATLRDCEPIVIHYHGERDARGFLMSARTPGLDRWLDEFNRRRAEVTGQMYTQMPRRSRPELLRRATAERLWMAVGEIPGYRLGGLMLTRKRVKGAIGRLRKVSR